MSPKRRLFLKGAAMSVLGPVVWTTAASARNPRTMPLDTLIAQAPNVPPDALFVLAARLFAAGRRDEAVTWFYAAQVRMRFRLAVAPDLPPDGEPALYEALFETIGPQINGWAFGDIDATAAHMQEALDWDQTHANTFTPKSGHAAELEQVRSGLMAFRAKILTQKGDFRREREAKGLENR